MTMISIKGFGGHYSDPAFIAEYESILAEYSRIDAVYFIQSGVWGPIKIGHAVNLARRLSQLQAMSGAPLFLLGQMPGGRDHEGRLHDRFAGSRLHNEWFRPTYELTEYIRVHALREPNPTNRDIPFPAEAIRELAARWEAA